MSDSMEDVVAANKALVEDYFAVINGEKLDTPIGDFFAENIRWRVPQSNPMFPEPLHGFDEVMTLFGKGVGVYQEGSLNISVESMTADEHRVCSQFTLDAVLQSGEPYKNDYVIIIEIVDGKFVSVFEYLDTLYQFNKGTFDDN